MQQLFLHLKHCFFGNNQRDLEKRWKNGEMRYFVKKLGSGNVGLQDPPPRSLTDLDYFHTFFSDIYKNEKQKQSSLGSLSLLSNDDGDGNEKGKKAIGLDWQNNNFARCYTTITWKCLISRFVEDGDTRQQLYSFFFSWSLIQSFRIQLQKQFATI